MDSDLAESISALKSAFESRRLPLRLGKADSTFVRAMHQKLRIPRRLPGLLHRRMRSAVGRDHHTVRGAFSSSPSAEVEAAQKGFALSEAGALITVAGVRPAGGPSWVIVATSSLLGDPYFLDTSKPDAEGDCPVYTAMSGTEVWQPEALCVHVCTLPPDPRGRDGRCQGLRYGRDYDVDNEQVFREAIGPKIREYDPAAVKAGHWT